jgi:hypothetical protein
MGGKDGKGRVGWRRMGKAHLECSDEIDSVDLEIA